MSKYTKEQILKEAKENGVEFIRLQFTDLFGIMKNVAITFSQLEKALDNDCMFDDFGLLHNGQRHTFSIGDGKRC